MTVFIVLSAVLILIAVAILVWPLVNGKTPDSTDRVAVNIAVAKQRLAELSRELDNGSLHEADYAQAKAELELALAGDMSDSQIASQTSGGKWMAALVLPDDKQGQQLLVQTYLGQGRFSDAINALEKWGARTKGDPRLLVQLAEATASQANGRLLGEPESLIAQALEFDPTNQQALWMMGFAQAQSNNPEKAIDYWEPLAALLPAGSDGQLRVQAMIEDVRVQNGMAAAEPKNAEGANGAGIDVLVTLAPELAAKVRPDTAVFIYAKAVVGPPMPVAAIKARVQDLPLRVRLDDSTAMIDTHRISAQQEVIVGARASLSGEPVATPGDLYIEREGIALDGAEVIELEISQIK